VAEYQATHGQYPSNQEIQDEVTRQATEQVYDVRSWLPDKRVQQFKMAP
jgi:hypothetical protein